MRTGRIHPQISQMDADSDPQKTNLCKSATSADGHGAEGDFGETRHMMDGKPYPIPKTWAESSIGKAVVKTKQRDPRKKPDEMFQYVDVSAVSNTSFKITSAAPTLGSEAPSRARKAIQTDDVLFATVRPTLKRIALVPPELDGAIASTGYCVLRCDKAKATPGFLYSFLITDHFNARMAGLERGASYPAVRDSDVTASWFPLPPLPEQTQIAHILSTVQRAIEAQERIIQTTTELKKALMHKLFTEGLRHEPQKQTEIGPVPKSWETPTVESVCTIKASAMSYSQLEKASNVSDGVRVIGIKVSDMNLPGNEIEFRSANLERLLTEKEARKRTVPADSIIFPKRGAAIATNKKRLTTGYTVLDPNLIAVMPSEAVSHRYLFHWFNTFDLKTITDPGPTPQLNKKDIAPLKFPMPTVDEQRAIAAAIDATEDKATLHTRKRDQLQDLFRTLLHELMTAKMRVNGITIPFQTS